MTLPDADDGDRSYRGPKLPVRSSVTNVFFTQMRVGTSLVSLGRFAPTSEVTGNHPISERQEFGVSRGKFQFALN